jgi:hypothetical protein
LSDPLRLIAHMIGDLSPVHATIDRFATGGPTIGREIERIHDLLRLERLIEDALGEAEDEPRRCSEELQSRNDAAAEGGDDAAGQRSNAK